MLHRPSFKPHFHVEPVERDGIIFLLSEQGHFVIFGEADAAVASAIDGRRTADQVVDRACDTRQLHELYFALLSLERNGYLSEADHDAPRDEAAFWAACGTEYRRARTRIARRQVGLTCLAVRGGHEAREALERLGISISEDPVDGEVELVVVDDYLHPALEAVNQRHLDSGRPWLIVKPHGMYSWVGPMFAPGQSACWRCVADRLRGNREVESYIERQGASGPFPVSVAALPASIAAVIQLAAVQVLALLGSEHDSTLRSRMLTLSWPRLDQEAHAVTRRPQCPACGDPGVARISADIPALSSPAPAIPADGGLRAVEPELTFERFAHLISPLTGVVSGIFPVPNLADTPLHVYTAGHNFALKNDSLYFLNEGLRSRSSGKGRTPSQARTSALCEAIERYSGVFRGEETRVRGRFSELGDEAIHPHDSMLFSERQYAERLEWLSRGSRFQIVPLPFDEHADLEWTPVRSLVTEQIRYLPTGYLYYGYPLDDEQFFFWADSNGAAAGNTLEEAMLQGFLEVVERDAVCLWWYNRVRRPALALEGLDDPYVERVVGFYERHRRTLWVLDLTNDLGIPAYAAISRRIDHTTEDIVMGFGAHLDARTAALRAIAELNQFMPAVLGRRPNGDTIYLYDDPDALAWWRSATLADQPYLAPLAAPPARVADHPSSSSGDVAADLATCVQRASRLGYEAFALNQTRPDVGLPVARVLVPGLRHFWARLAPGRLYDTPVELGWLPAAHTEETLNPVAMFV
ncbi:MAG TPA: TOMM precursor leader peptide-binding protein [Solirubrobacteraceae bacterium]|jgi:ribosomal protein S12 methylthiotransferase accessory factor